MDKFQKTYIGLIKAALTDTKCAVPSDFDWAKAVETSKRHSVSPILFYGAVNSNISKETEYMKELHLLTIRGVMVSTRQLYEIELIENAFKKENIDYMPLKGIVLKQLYLQPEMRMMGDADILIKTEQYPKIEKIMTELGFAFKYESDHELVWEKPSLFLELHKSVMTSYNKDFYRYFGNGWKLAEKNADCSRYDMSAENFYIYMFVHFTKHYRITGIGIKHLIDLWVYIKAYSGLDWEYIARELKEMNLTRFHQNVLNTIDAWFNDGDGNTVTDLITNVIFNSGEYGSAEMSMVNRALQKGKDSALKIKFSKIFNGLFPSYKTMKEKYKILEKAPFLLPVMWGVRCFNVLFRQKDTFKSYIQGVKKVDSKQVDENKRALYAVGLEFHSEK